MENINRLKIGSVVQSKYRQDSYGLIVGIEKNMYIAVQWFRPHNWKSLTAQLININDIIFSSSPSK